MGKVRTSHVLAYALISHRPRILQITKNDKSWDSWRIVFFQTIRDGLRFSNEMKQLCVFMRSRWIRPESPRYCDEYTAMRNNLFGNTAIS